MNKYLEVYVPFMDFLAEYLGSNTEIVLHDLTDWNCSVVAIKNGHISGRKVGSPVTDLALQLLNEAAYKSEPYVTGYQSRSKDGQRLKSATYFIRDNHQNVVGMLCLNTDYRDLVVARDLLNTLIKTMGIPTLSGEVAETFNLSVTDLIESNLDKVYPDNSVPARDLTPAEKLDIVSRLNDMGTFLMKGAVGYVAERLEVSIPTMYRYLNMVKQPEE